MNKQLLRPDDFYMYPASTLRPKPLVANPDAPEPIWNIYRKDFINGVHQMAEGASFAFKISHQEDIVINGLYSIDIVKKFIIELAKLFPFPTPTKCLRFFNTFSLKVMGQFIPNRKYMNPVPNEIWAFVSDFLVELRFKRTDAEITASIVATIFQNDMAYYLRETDLASETTKEKFMADPRGEIKRIFALHQQRDTNQTVKSNFMKVGKILRFILLIPWIKSAFLRAMKKRNFANFQYDEADRYYACLRSDYMHFGMTMDERKKLFESKGWFMPIDFSGRSNNL